ncbi:organic cation transporter protein-like isoform X2 [Chelonus insularis]|uniref:organic cation transporter protein-like isoform X2 n=1 Tax=Chelonus insularis TaxID=460826 RepID=UPI00158AC797|nr:organic cation transporter protein-like isoform X2 [Chelonus insularis]
MLIEDLKVGCFQIALLFLLGINYMIVAMSHNLSVYHNYTPKFYCESSDGVNKTYGCVSNPSNNLNSNSSMMINNQVLTFCTSEYIFSTEYGERSTVTDWGLICERSYLKDLSVTIYYVGVLIGAWIAGILTDRIGRLPVLALCLYTQGTMAVATYIVQSYPVFLALRGLQGVFAQGLQSSTYILVLELFPAKFRTLVSSVMGVAWVLGLLLLAILSYIIPDWRILQLGVSVPTATTVLYIWIIPDSPRWLIAKGKTTEADISLEKIGNYNNCCCGNKSRRELVAENSENATPIKLERKSQIFSNDEKDPTESEAVNLLTPTTSSNRSSRHKVEEPLKRISHCGSDVISPNEENQEEQIARVEYQIIDNNLISDEKIESTEVKNEEKAETKEVSNSKISNKCCSSDNKLFIKYGMIISCQWLSVSVMNSLIIRFLPNVVENRHINFVIGGILELTIYVVIYFILSRHGRRLPMGVCQTLNSVICIVIAGLVFLPRVTAFWIGSMKIILLLLGKLTAVSTFAIIYLYTIELFPTVVRATSLGLCVIVSTIGSISTPYILLLANNASTGLFIFAGLLCLTSSLLCIALPETLGNYLPDNFQDMRNLGKVELIKSNNMDDGASEREILREKLFSETWVDAGNGIIVNFNENKI